MVKMSPSQNSLGTSSVSAATAANGVSPLCPFGLSSAPWCFIKLLRPVVLCLHACGLRLIVYLEDLLLMAQEEILRSRIPWTIDLFPYLGSLMKWEKSNLIPATKMEFLGFMGDSVSASLCPSPLMLRIIRKKIRHVLVHPHIILHHLGLIIGLLVASIQAISIVPLHYQALQRLKIAHLCIGASYANWIVLDKEVKD